MGRHMFPFRWGLDQWVGSAKTAEPIEMPSGGLIQWLKEQRISWMSTLVPPGECN